MMKTETATPDQLASSKEPEFDPHYVPPEAISVALDPTDMASKGPKKKGTWSVPIGCC
jgi:hypothetical protein